MPIFGKAKGVPLINWNNVGNRLKNLWNDFTGQTAVDLQNKGQLELAKYQAQLNEDYYNKYSSPEAMMRQYQQAGLNPNLVYGSLASGQGNVPSFQSPTLTPNITGHQKFDKMLSTVSGIMGLVQGVYQTTAAREAAEQSTVRTLRDIVGLSKEEGDLRWQNSLFGHPLYDNFYVRRYKGNSPTIGTGVYSGTGFLPTYIQRYRENQINTFIRSGMQNAADFGFYEGGDFGSKLKGTSVFGTPNLYIRNQSNAFKYQLMRDLGNKGVYGKLAISLLNAIL